MVHKGTAHRGLGSNNIFPRKSVLVSSSCIFGTVCVFSLEPIRNIETMNTSTVRPSLFAFVAFLFVLALGAAPQVHAQIQEEEEEEPILITEDELNQLLVWYVDEKYEKVLFKAIRYTEDDEQKKHPVPYLYMAKGYLGIHNSDDSDLRETYEVDKLKALKNALKYAGKFVKKDKEMEYVPQEQEFLEDLRKETIIAAETEMDNGKYTKAKSYYKYLTTIDEEDPGAWMMYGTVFLALKARRDADIAWETATNLLKDQQARGLTEGQRELLQYAFVMTIEKLDEMGDRAAARTFISLGDQFVGGDREFEAVKRSIGG
jgi:tetratricopeptide (TPR) repeat protein